MLLLGVVQLAVERHPLLVQLAAAFFGGGNGQTVFGQAIDDAAMLGRAPIDEPLLRGDLIVQFSEITLRRGDRRLQFRKLRLKRPQVTPPRDQAGGDAARADGQCSVGFEQIAGQCDVSQTRTGPGGE